MSSSAPIVPAPPSTPVWVSPRAFRLHHMADWVLCLLLAVSDLLMVKFWSPHCRTFQWNDATIGYPMHDNTFPNYSLALMAAGTGCFFLAWYAFIFRCLRHIAPAYGEWCPYNVPWAVEENNSAGTDERDEEVFQIEIGGEQPPTADPSRCTSPLQAGSPSSSTRMNSNNSRHRGGNGGSHHTSPNSAENGIASPTPRWAASDSGFVTPLFRQFRSYACTTGPVYSWLTALIWSEVMTLFTTEVLKRYAGRLRPDYLARLSSFGYTEGAVKHGTVIPDPQQDPAYYCELGHSLSDVLRDGRLSFPSGHSSTSMCISTILCLFLFAHLRPFAFRGSLLRFCVSMSPVWMALICGTSRTRDNRHNFSDVLAGWMIGLCCALIGFALCFRIAGGPSEIVLERAEDDIQLRKEEKRWLQYLHRRHLLEQAALPEAFGGADKRLTKNGAPPPPPIPNTESANNGRSGYGGTDHTAEGSQREGEVNTQRGEAPPVTLSSSHECDDSLGCLCVTQKEYHESTQAVPWL